MTNELYSNLIIAAEAKEFAVNLRSEGWKENFMKMVVYPLMKSVPCFEEDQKNVFLTIVKPSVQ